MKYTKKEVKDLIFAWLLISIAFAVLFSGGGKNIIKINFLVVFAISALTAGIGFLFHELMHKYVAQKYRLYAEFQAFYKMLFLAILFSFFGFIFAAPGAVMIRGYITKERNGRISLAGPLTNIILSLAFLIPLLIFDFSVFFEMFFDLGFKINALLALFNMIPVMPFDGGKVFIWDKKVYWITVLVAGGLFILSFFI